MNKKGLLALATGTFALGISEFVMMGILGNLADSMHISISEAGHFISAYAAGVCVGAPALLFARRMHLKTIMLILAAIITIGNLMAALAPGYWSLIVARFISGLPHGAYFGVGAIVARKLASPGRGASAVSFMIAGMTIATLGGVPLGTFLSGALSWRLAFSVVAIAGFLTFFALHSWIPQLQDLEDLGFKGQFRFLRTLPPWLIFGGVIFGQIGFYCWYSYIDPQLTLVSKFPPASLPWLMVLAGLGMVLGNLVSGRLSDRYKPSWVAGWVQTCGIPVLVAFFFLSPFKIAAVPLMMLGTAILFGSGSPLQSSIVGYARGGEMLGAACIQIAYNAGNAIAAYVGGAVIDRGFSYVYTSIVGLPFIMVGCVLLFVLYGKYEHDSTKT